MTISSKINSEKSSIVKIAGEKEYLLIILAALLVIGNLFWIILDYRNLSVHPHVIYDIMPYFTKDGIGFTWNDMVKPLQEMGNPGEYRPRFLTYGISLIDIKLQSFFYQYFIAHPTASISWILSLFIAPIYLYKLLRYFTNSKKAQVAGIIVYLSSMGFLSGFSTMLVPGKTLTSTVFILTIYCMTQIHKLQTDRQLFFQIRSKHKTIMFFVVFLGLFLDEVSFMLLFLVPILFLELFYLPVWRKDDIYRNIKNIIYFGLPFFLFSVVVIFVVPILTQHFWNYDFRYLSSLTGAAETARGAKTFFLNACGDSLLLAFYKNFLNLFGTAMVPYQISPLIHSVVPGDGCHGMFTQENNLLKGLLFLAIFPALFFYAFRNRFQNPFTIRLIVVILVFIGLETILHKRHIPIINGYYYGACFSVFFSMLAGNLYSVASRHISVYKILVSSSLLVLVVVQAGNFKIMNKTWIVGHNNWTKNRYGVAYEGWEGKKLKTMFNNQEAKKQYESPYPVNIAHPVPLGRAELHKIYDSWKAGTLQEYLNQNGISSGAVYLLFYLKNIDVSRLNNSHK
ncbi:MAG: hypothetical protein FD156_1774 [Nitrospirae bacterium]|nr:MAG: hypothetical protein FD156_1774 [Nitrospirota bacterium]